MPRYSRYSSRRFWRYNPYRRWRRRYPSRSGRGTYTATKKGNKRINVSLQKQFTLTYHIAANSYESNVWIISPFGYASGTQSCVGTLTSLPTYQAYASLFDEFKLNSLSVRFNVTRTLSGFSDATTDFMTCIDRHGNVEDITNRMTLNQVENSSSAVRTTFNGQSTFTTTRSYRATDFMEKYTFYDASYQDNPSSPGRYIEAWYNNANNTGFTPLIYSALKTTLATAASTRDITCTADITYNLTFRNPKNGITVSSAKAAAEAIDPDAKVTIVTEEDDETPETLPKTTEEAKDPDKMTDDPPTEAK